MSKPRPYPRIRWPKTKSKEQLQAMTKRQALRYACRLHVAYAEDHRRRMEWDLYWAEFYRKALRENR